MIGEDAKNARTPALWLSPNDSKPHPYCSLKHNWAHYISAGNNLELNKWYHITYTLSEPQKRMEFYVNGDLIEYTNVKDIIFNEFPLKIGHSDKYADFQEQTSNFRYYNIRLSADEIFKDYILYHNNELDRNRENEQHARNPAFWLSPNDSKPHPYCSLKHNWSYYISAKNNLELNKWYHIAYTLSESQKHMEFYVNGELVGYTDVKDIIFNEFPLKVGHSDKYSDFQGQMRYDL
ncbi:37148_t:CDS:2 [Gigaspora margarita]|uniref:37148_t:CDS:1 n=1 Tax=Gigaspora margarita TaxID=4874 RepID=A0ABM8W1E0_GIGMA|nr:37148_t:CDS:2 [Gigaspora margarita]